MFGIFENTRPVMVVSFPALCCRDQNGPHISIRLSVGFEQLLSELILAYSVVFTHSLDASSLFLDNLA